MTASSEGKKKRHAHQNTLDPRYTLHGTRAWSFGVWPEFVCSRLLTPSGCSANAENKCSPNASLWCLCVWLFVLRGVMGRLVFGESTPITHLTNDWGLLIHLSSPFWSRQHSNRSSYACLQEGFCSVWLRSHCYSAAECFRCTSGGNRTIGRRAAEDRVKANSYQRRRCRLVVMLFSCQRT